MRREFLTITLLGLLLVGSALGVVHSQHRSRLLFADIQRLQKQADELNIEWGRLQLEQSTWAAHGRIERLAREKLAMHPPNFDELEFLLAR